MNEVGAVWWIELIKVSPGLITVLLAIFVVCAYHGELKTLLSRVTRFKGVGIEAEFSVKTLTSAISAHNVVVGEYDKYGAIKRLQAVAPLLRDAQILWVDDNPESTRNERALVEYYGARNTTVISSRDAERELHNNVFVMMITDIEREGNATEGLEFVDRMVQKGIMYPRSIAYVATDQKAKPRPANLFAITNRPDELMQYVCDVIERERF
jgi:CheY-like chemotaxis protein